MSLKDTSRRHTTPDEPELVAAHDALFMQMKADAERLVRQIKDLAYDEAVLQLLTKILDVRRAVQDEVMADMLLGPSPVTRQHPDGLCIWGWDGNRERPTLTPSVNCIAEKDGKPTSGCGWHGFITNGVMR